MGQFELTHRCNLKCQHCYIVNDSRREELTYKELCHIFDEVYQEGCLWLCLTGGEPLLRKDFLDIYSYAYKKGFIITIFTNATFLNEEIAKYLKRFPPFCIELTLNGVTKKSYELITQTPGSFEKAMRGIELIRKHNLPLKLKCQAMTLNFDEFPLMRRFYQEMGMVFRCSTLIDPRMDGSTGPCSLRLPVEKILELESREEIVKGRDEIEDGFKEEPLTEQENEVLPPSDELFHCPGGTWAFYINPFGELYFCNSVRKPTWDLRSHSFKQGFYDFFPKIRSRKFKTDSECRTCPLWQSCLRCPGKAELECGDVEAPIPYYCELAHKLEEAGKAITIR
ncbi:MAG: radical SAM protein [Candidatus Omnitrophica bacterium]|nr:radical SAM protein [Candidatus Omnitrophota bacterium]